MPAKPLSNIQEVVELTLFHAIRTEVVSQGYLPDITTFANTQAGSDAYYAAINAIATGAKGFAVEVFNNSNPEYKGLKKIPRIVLLSEMYMPGDVGGTGNRYYVEKKVNGNTVYDVYSRPPQTVDFSFSIHLVCDSAVQYRVLVAMLANAIPLRGYIPAFKRTGLNSDDFNFFIQNISFADLPVTSEAVMEYVLRYEVKDVLLVEYISLIETVPALKEIIMDMYEQDKKLTNFLRIQ